MISWFNSIFAQPAQKAQLVAILMSAVVAVFVLLLNQWFTSRRVRKELYILKIEELYSVICEYELLSYDFVALLFSGKGVKESTKEIMNKTLASLQNIEMYTELHFPEISFDRKKYEGYVKELYQSSLDGRAFFYVSESGAFVSHTEVMEKIQNDTDEIKRMTKNLMSRYKH
ncbi:hypothetical protein [Vibrio sp. A14(2019)]|uniref:hypothetical protein n=1 Tax=Vibrio sp. A14(2019) TaxID=2591428 RepID=UPI0012AE576B|nr:hypothetical protein [Vibrio sp. A14(2019)]MDQ2194896.1 hypothetical protein [Vibrio sp. A14(2019)]